MLSLALSLLGTVFGSFKKILGSLFSNPKSLAILIIAGALIYGGFKIESHIKDLNHQVVATQQLLKQANQDKADDQAKINQDKTDIQNALSANTANVKIIEQMKRDQTRIENGLREMNAKIGQNQQNMQVITTHIQEAPKSADGPISKVLGDTINEIQNTEKGE